MRVTMAMLFDGLDRLFPCLKGDEFNPETVTFAAFSLPFENSIDFSDKACVITPDEFPDAGSDIAPEHIIVVSPEIPAGQNFALWVRSDNSVDSIVDKANDALLVYQAWAEDLSSSSMRGDGLETMTDHAHRLFNNPILILDRSAKVLACTSDDPMDDVMWAPFVEQTSARIRLSDGQDILRYHEALRKQKYLMDYPVLNDNVMASCLCCELGDDFVAVCLIHKNREITLGDFECLKFFSTLIGMSVLADRSAWGNKAGGYNVLIADAIEGRLTDDDEFRGRLSILGITPKSMLEMMVIGSRKGYLNDFQLRRLACDIEKVFPFGHTLAYNHSLLLVNDFDEGKGPNGVDYDRLGTYLDCHRLTVGVSDRDQSPSNLAEMYQQACIAMRIGCHTFKDESVYRFDRCRPYCLFETCVQSGNWHYYLHPALDTLKAHDEFSENRLLPILASFVENRGNRTETARALYIQRSTLQSRIREIERVCDINLSDHATFLHLRLSFALNEYCTEATDSCARRGR